MTAIDHAALDQAVRQETSLMDWAREQQAIGDVVDPCQIGYWERVEIVAEYHRIVAAKAPA